MGLYLLKFPYRRMLDPLARRLRWLHPDVVTYAALPVAAATAWCFYRAAEYPSLLLWAVGLIFVRMTLNTLDGLLAMVRGHLSLRGEIVNALPDRYADLLVLAGIALSPLCTAWLGVAAIGSTCLVSYCGMLGKAVGVSWQHHGPLGKVERLVILMAAAITQYLTLRGGETPAWLGVRATPMEWAMGLFVVLGQICVLNRLRGQLREIRRKEALERLNPARHADRALVVFDSVSGNTRLVAEQIAAGLGCAAAPIARVGDLSRYDLVVVGSPTHRMRPTKPVRRWLRQNGAPPTRLAVFTTSGLPLWGAVSAPRCLRAMARRWGTKPVARFRCPGFHAKYRTCRGRPNEADLLAAFLFGLKLSGLLDRSRRA